MPDAAEILRTPLSETAKMLQLQAALIWSCRNYSVASEILQLFWSDGAEILSPSWSDAAEILQPTWRDAAEILQPFYEMIYVAD